MEYCTKEYLFDYLLYLSIFFLQSNPSNTYINTKSFIPDRGPYLYLILEVYRMIQLPSWELKTFIISLLTIRFWKIHREMLCCMQCCGLKPLKRSSNTIWNFQDFSLFFKSFGSLEKKRSQANTLCFFWGNCVCCAINIFLLSITKQNKTTTHWFLLCKYPYHLGQVASVFLTDLCVSLNTSSSVFIFGIISTVFGVYTSPGLPDIKLCLRKTVCCHIWLHSCTVQRIIHTEGRKSYLESYLVTTLSLGEQA